ncbi:M16 family metallopeptidase [Saccharospirillum salsuginis]|uniref:Zinc protease n=1 Tax=Saccharospirillum salsuginis TaxID=418750 RepID=A0A918N9A1_9GAMM|nr:insulinase family protein [Saccharospirillum salsuginis]GGX55823.1 zinc protease [Saccharospirillum salsuginis]
MTTSTRNAILRHPTTWIGTIILTGCASMAGQQSLTPDHELIALYDNEEVVSGELPNGFNYHIDTWAENASTVEFRLKVDFGSLDEAQDELGYAHFIEHMAFNGTEHYPGQSLTDYLKSTGMDFGGDINAYTDFDETVYQLSVPADQPDLVTEAYQVLADWAGGIQFDPAEVEAEKGVVIEEWRLGNSGEAPVWLQQYQSLYQGTDYIERLPIGTPESIEQATAESLRALYERTYRADRMTLYVSGGLSLGDAQYQIHKAFADLPRATDFEPNRPEVDYQGGRYWVASDETITGSYLEQGRVLRPDPLTTVPGQQDELFSELLIKALEERSEQWGDQQTPMVDVEVYAYFQEDDAYVIDLIASPRGPLSVDHAADLESLWQQLIQHGISKEEYQLYGRRLINDLTVQGDALADYSAAERLDWIKFVTESGMTLFDWDDYIDAGQYLHSYYRHDDFNVWLRKHLTEAPIVAGAVVTPNEVSDWNSDELQAVIEQTASRSVAAMDVVIDEQSELALNRRPGEVTLSVGTEIPNLIRMKLSNGLTVWYYPTDIEQNRVIVNLVSRGGTAVKSREDAVLDLFWSNALMDTPPATMSHSAYLDWQNQHGIDGSVYSFDTSSGLYWDGRPDGIDWMLAMIAHQMQPMTFADATVEEYQVGTRDYLTAFPDTPNGRTEAAIKPFIIDQPGFATLTLDDLEGVTVESLTDYQSQWLAKGTGLDLFVIGNVGQDDLVDALEANLAGVPLPDVSDGAVDPYHWSGQQRVRVPAHGEDRTDIDMRIRLTEAIWDQSQRKTANLTAAMLEDYLMSEIREAQGDSYDVTVGVDQAEPEIPATYLIINTSTAPARAEAVLDTVETALAEPDIWLTDDRLEMVKRQDEESDRRMRNNLYEILEDMEFFTRTDRTLEDYTRMDKIRETIGLKDSRQFLSRVQSSEDRLILTIEPRKN